MSASAIVMLLIGAIGLWGGLAASIWNYARNARQEPARPAEAAEGPE